MKNQTRNAKPRGFALVVTLSMMILLTVIAVGLLSLSSVSLRTSGQTSDMSAARANARMALILAIGELQTTTGPDTRITARANIIDDSNPAILGVWTSWEGGDHDGTGLPKTVNYSDHKKSKFLAWLTSESQQETIQSMDNLPDASTASAGRITLLGDHTVGTKDAAQRQIHLTPTSVVVNKTKGSYAWWVGGENQKALLPKPYTHSASQDNSARWSMNAKSHAVADPKPFRMDHLIDEPEIALKGISMNQVDLISKPGSEPASQEFFHDLTTNSVGLLTNVATGGWKKDLSLFTEQTPGLLGTTALPFFKLLKDKDLLGALPTSGNPTPAKSMIYPWANYRGSGSDWPIYQHGPVTSWENLRNYAQAYTRMNIGSTGKGTMSVEYTDINGTAGTSEANVYSYLHRVRIMPVIARIQWVFSHTAGTPPPPPAGQPANPPGSMEPRLLLTPVITLWNPYNVQITSIPLRFNVGKPLPVALKYTVGGLANANFNSLLTGNTNNSPALATTGNLPYRIDVGLTLRPGETRIFSPAGGIQSPTGTELVLQQGYRSTGGHYLPIRRDDGKAYVSSGSTTIKAEAKFNTTYQDNAADGTPSTGVGIFLDVKTGADKTLLAYRMVYETSVAEQIYKPLASLAQSDSLTTVAAKPSPFMTTVFGARMASSTLIAAKGFVQSSPLVNYTAMGGKDMAETTIRKHYYGTSHPVNSPFDYSFNAVGGAGDSLLPQVSDSTGRGYIVTGFTVGDGLSRCIIDELPTRPIQSLAELQNWDLRYDNPIPPFSFNIIGNSDASPLLPSDAVINTKDKGQATNLQYDDSYCANHVLFDDCFFSSITKDPTTYGKTGKALEETYKDLLTGDAPLGNRAYLPIPEDVSRAKSGDATKLYNENVNKKEAWRKIASRLEVEGMFNVNSTSVTAWRALLGHARHQKVPYFKDSGLASSVELPSAFSDYAFSRFSVAGDAEAKSSSTSGAFNGAAEFAGYRLFDEQMLDALASEIVEQVRLRGPFLSLSEFINRQLSSGDLARAGAVQTALNEIQKSSSTNPYSGITGNLSRQAFAQPAQVPGKAEYQYPDAAAGYNTYGLPGWTRQADVLRAIAPILTARDDTFTIRAYGDSRGADGAIKASAYCEAVVRRTREFVDSSELADITTYPTRPINQDFGRRYKLVSFRWLNANEI
jgi:hypothetical protein